MENTPTSVDEKSDRSPQIHEGIATVSNEEVSVATAEHLEGGTRILVPTATFTLEEEKRIIQLLNWHIMPLIFLLYSLSVLGPLESRQRPYCWHGKGSQSQQLAV
jgi:hypothetical protein